MSAVLDTPRPTPARPTVRTLVNVGLGFPLLGVALLTAVVLVTLVAAGADLRVAPAVVSGLWLGAHQVPLVIDGTPLSVLPLLPTIVIVWMSARAVATSGVGGRATAAVAAGAVTGPLVLATVAVAVIDAAGLPLSPPPFPVALGWVAGVHLVGALAGALRASGALAHLGTVLPPWAVTALRAVPAVLAMLLVGGAALTAVALALSWSTASALFGAGGGVAGMCGLLLLSVGYLPNVVVGAAAFTLGPGVVLGRNTVTAFGAVPAPTPSLPLLAVLPEGGGSWWWPVMLVVPAAVAGWCGWWCARRSEDLTSAIRSVGATAVLGGMAMGLVGLVAGGSLGSGAFGPVGVPLAATIVAGAAWIAVVGSATALVMSRRRRSPAG